MASAQRPKRNVSFVCSENRWRSPTEEKVFSTNPDLAVRSGGTSSSAEHTVTIDDVRWAHVVVMMEDKHGAWLLAQFKTSVRHKPIHVLGIPDRYRRMDPALVALLERSVGAALEID